MLVETVEHRVRLVKPRSFAGLMSLYEGNYARLRQLLGNLRHLPTTLISKSATDMSIYLILSDRSRYTTTLRMTYLFDKDGIVLADPDLLVRVYHDARLAEAVSCSERQQHSIIKNFWFPAAEAFEKRWLLNVLLCKWLEHCLDHRHVFA